MPHKRSERELDSLAVKVARITLEQGRSLGKAADLLSRAGDDVRDERDARRLLLRARSRNLVTVTVNQVMRSPFSINREMGRAVSQAYGVRDVLVVQTELATDDDYLAADPRKRTAAFQESDNLHTQLGEVAAQYLWEHLRNGDSIAVGDGRATFSTVNFMGLTAKSNPRSFSDISIYSLSGAANIGTWGQNREVGNLDADNVAIQLAVALDVPSEKVHLVRLPLALDSSQRAVVKKIAPHLWDGAARSPSRAGRLNATVALFGVGVLNSGYHLLQYQGPQVMSIRQEIEALKTKVLPKLPAAVGGICSQFFWIGDDRKFASLKPVAEEIIHSLQEKIVSIGLRQLDEIKEKIMIAGGAQKYPAIKAVLTRKPISVTVLVTDVRTAQRLLEER